MRQRLGKVPIRNGRWNVLRRLVCANVHIAMSDPARQPPFPYEGMARIFQILADPTRLQLLQAMSTECKSVSRLVVESGLPQPQVSRHLRILRDAGLARSERRGAYKFY